MPPITLSGIVTKVGFMNKTATVTVSNWYTHPKTMKVCFIIALRAIHISLNGHFRDYFVIKSISLMIPTTVRLTPFSTLLQVLRFTVFYFCFAVLRQDDQVVIQNCPPVSKRKRFTLHKILKSPDQEREARHSPEAAAELARIKEASKGKRIEETLKVTTF